jgi:hypothetical protein
MFKINFSEGIISNDDTNMETGFEPECMVESIDFTDCNLLKDLIGNRSCYLRDYLNSDEFNDVCLEKPFYYFAKIYIDSFVNEGRVAFENYTKLFALLVEFFDRPNSDEIEDIISLNNSEVILLVLKSNIDLFESFLLKIVKNDKLDPSLLDEIFDDYDVEILKPEILKAVCKLEDPTLIWSSFERRINMMIDEHFNIIEE